VAQRQALATHDTEYFYSSEISIMIVQ